MSNQFHMAPLPWLVVCGTIMNLEVSAIVFNLPRLNLFLTDSSQRIYRFFQKKKFLLHGSSSRVFYLKKVLGFLWLGFCVCANLILIDMSLVLLLGASIRNLADRVGS